MKAQFVNEKFDDTSDPIADMNIGGFNYRESYNENVGPAIIKWQKMIRKSLEGKRIRGKFRQTANEYTRPSFSLRVAKVYFYAEGYIEVESAQSHAHYGLDIDEKYYVVNES